MRTVSPKEYAEEVGKSYRTILNWINGDGLPEGVSSERLPSGTLLVHIIDTSFQCPHCKAMVWKSQLPGEAFGKI